MSDYKQTLTTDNKWEAHIFQLQPLGSKHPCMLDDHHQVKYSHIFLCGGPQTLVYQHKQECCEKQAKRKQVHLEGFRDRGDEAVCRHIAVHGSGKTAENEGLLEEEQHFSCPLSNHCHDQRQVHGHLRQPPQVTLRKMPWTMPRKAQKNMTLSTAWDPCWRWWGSAA